MYYTAAGGIEHDSITDLDEKQSHIVFYDTSFTWSPGLKHLSVNIYNVQSV